MAQRKFCEVRSCLYFSSLYFLFFFLPKSYSLITHLLKTASEISTSCGSVTSENFEFFEMAGRGFLAPTVGVVVLVLVFQETEVLHFLV